MSSSKVLPNIAIFAIALAVVASGCAAEFINVTSGAIGCPREEIAIHDKQIRWASSSWTAECRGSTYYCSGTTGNISCQPAVASSAPTETSDAVEATSGGPAPAANDQAGCQYDTQCKGDRVCVHGSCVEPSTLRPVAKNEQPTKAGR